MDATRCSKFITVQYLHVTPNVSHLEVEYLCILLWVLESGKKCALVLVIHYLAPTTSVLSKIELKIQKVDKCALYILDSIYGVVIQHLLRELKYTVR